MRTALALALLCTGCATASAEEAPLTWARLRSMPPEAVTRELFGEFGRSLFLVPGQIPDRDGRFIRPLRHLYFRSRPRASYRAGVCETDWISAEFGSVPGSPAAPGSEPRARPLRLALLTNFIVQDLDKVRVGGPSVDELPDLERACAAIDPTKTPSIIADSAFDIISTVPLVADLVATARAGRPLAPMECEGDEGPMPEQECLRMLAALKPEAISIADSGGACLAKAADTYCVNASAWQYSRQISISFELKRGGNRVPQRIRVHLLPDERSVMG